MGGSILVVEDEARLREPLAHLLGLTLRALGRPERRRRCVQ